MRSTFFFIFTCLIYTAVAQDTSTNAELSSPENGTSVNKVHVAIYYESLCPDSISFLLTQFGPAYNTFKNYIDVLFVPFGKSESEKNGSIFYCQHGPAECSGNRLQSCVLDALGNNQDAKVKFVTCQMNWNVDYTGQKCAESVNVSFADVTSCVSGSKGTELQLNAEKETHLIAKPYPSFIPTIVYNKTFDRSNQRQSLRAFPRALCNILTPTLQPTDRLLKVCGARR